MKSKRTIICKLSAIRDCLNEEKSSPRPSPKLIAGLEAKFRSLAMELVEMEIAEHRKAVRK